MHFIKADRPIWIVRDMHGDSLPSPALILGWDAESPRMALARCADAAAPTWVYVDAHTSTFSDQGTANEVAALDHPAMTRVIPFKTVKAA